MCCSAPRRHAGRRRWPGPVPPGPVARASGWAARPSVRSPLDHDRPESTVEMMGEKVKSLEGRTPTESDFPGRGEHEPAVGSHGRGLYLVGPRRGAIGPVKKLPERVQRLGQVSHGHGGPGTPAGLDRCGQGGGQGSLPGIRGRSGPGSGGAGPTGTDRNCGQHRANDTSAGCASERAVS